MGVAVGVLGVQTDLCHQAENLFLPLLFIGIHFVDIQRLSDDVGNGHPGVQGGVGVLEHHGGLSAVFQNVLLGFDLLAVEENLTGGGLVQMQ